MTSQVRLAPEKETKTAVDGSVHGRGLASRPRLIIVRGAGRPAATALGAANKVANAAYDWELDRKNLVTRRHLQGPRILSYGRI